MALQFLFINFRYSNATSIVQSTSHYTLVCLPYAACWILYSTLHTEKCIEHCKPGRHKVSGRADGVLRVKSFCEAKIDEIND